MWKGVYFESWGSRWTGTGATMDLALIPADFNLVYLSFVNPMCSYTKGQNSFANTGLQFSQDFAVVKEAIAILKKRGVRVLLAVGGATYGFTVYSPAGVAALVDDLGVDGVDLDWEPAGGKKDDGFLGPIIAAFRQALPRPKVLGLAGFSVGCYGAMKWKDSLPVSDYAGQNILGITTNGSDLDYIGIMAYDASPVYNPIEAYESYRQYYLGDIIMGAEIGQQGWGGALLRLNDVKALATCAQGVFVWSYLKQGSPSALEVIKEAAKYETQPVPVPAPVPTPVPVPNDPLLARVAKLENQMSLLQKWVQSYSQ